MNTQEIERQQDLVLEQMRRIRGMRRGTLSAQHYPQRRARRGGAGAAGPYFVWQGYAEGRHFSHRIGPDEVEDVKREIASRRRFEDLCAQYVALGEAWADGQRREDPAGEGLKKKPRWRSRRTPK